MRVYRIVAITLIAVLLVVLAIVLTSNKQASVVTTTTDAPTTTVPVVDHDDGVVSAAERTAAGPNVGLNTLNRIAQVACAAVGAAVTRQDVRTAVLTRAQVQRPGVDAAMIATLTDTVAAVACATAYSRLP